MSRTRWPELLVLLLALLTRVWRLDYHSLWFDEAVSMTWARSAPEYAWDSTFHLVKDKHPPAYYLLLHFWRELFKPLGLENNDVALRLLGSLLGVLTVLGVLLLARRLSGRRTALLAGALTALAPALVWYSQELRMFQPAATALVWGAFFQVAAMDSGRRVARWAWWLAMVAAFTLALYSYLFAAFALPAAGLVLLAAILPCSRANPHEGVRATQGDETPARSVRTTQEGDIPIEPRSPHPQVRAGGHAHVPVFAPRRLTVFIEGSLALAVTAALYLPLAFNAWAANASDGAPGQPFMNFLPNLQRQLQVATVWRVDWSPPWSTLALGLFGLLLLAGLTLPWRHLREVRTSRRWGDRFFLAAWLGTPLLVGNLLLARNDTIFAEDRYFLYLAPFALWAVARGAAVIAQHMSRFVGQHVGNARSVTYVGLGAITALLLLAALPRLWSPATLREDWRAAATYIADYQDSSPGLPAAAVAHIDYTRTPLNWYLRQRYDRDRLPVYFPFGGVIDPATVEQVVAPPLRGIEESGVATLWLTQSHLDGLDDARAVEGWLNQTYPLVTEQYPTGVKLSGYAVQSRFAELPPLASNAVRPGAELAPNLLLAACEITTPQVQARDERLHPPSGWVHVRLWWQATGPIDGDYIATVRMVGPEGVWGDRLYREDESLRRWPTSTWDHTDFVRDEVDVNLNPVTPPGSYPIVVGVMDWEGRETEKTVECGSVEVR